jgi:signal transduction histidine kinase
MNQKTNPFPRKIRMVMIVSLILPVCLSLLLVTVQTIAYRSHESEITALLGTVAQVDESAAVRGIQQYLAGNTEDASEQAAMGENILSQAGYGQTASKFIGSRFYEGSHPTWAICFVILVTLAWLFFAGRSLYRFEGECSIRVEKMEREGKRKDEYYHALVKEIEGYEGNLYHQMKTPITAISLCFQNLAAESAEISQQGVYKMAQIQIQKLNRLCTQLLRDQQLSSNKIRFRYEAHSLVQILESAVALVEPLAAWKQSPIQFETDVREATIVYDEVWLSECVITLLENAVEHTKSKEPVVLELQEMGGSWRITAFSGGTVLSEDQMSRLFDRFYTQRSDHFGIGLHMAMTIAQMHHGFLRAENAENGVRFILELPKLNGAEAYDLSPFCKSS